LAKGHNLVGSRTLANHDCHDVRQVHTELRSGGKVYSTIDEQFATNLSSDLQKRGVKVWIGRFELLPGDSLFFKIGEGIAQSQVFIIVLSPRSVASRWCQMELANAIALERERDGVFVIPALYESCEIPTLIKDKVYGDMRSDKYDASLARIVEMIRSSRRVHQEAR
jgi:TIR domain